MSRRAFLEGKLGRWFPRDSALNWKLLSIKITKQSRAIQRSGYNFESNAYDSCVSQAGLLGDIECPGCFMAMILDIDDPDLLSCRHFSIGQQVFYNLEIAALLLLNTNIYLIKEIPSYLIVVRRSCKTYVAAMFL